MISRAAGVRMRMAEDEGGVLEKVERLGGSYTLLGERDASCQGC